MRKYKIIYIIGAGRSGTTLLDIVLGNQAGVFSAGELNRYCKRLTKPHDPRDNAVSNFWETVSNQIDLEDFSANSLALFESLEYHSSIFKSSNYKANKVEYFRFNQLLFDSISKKIGGDSIIIDSSKYPLRGKYLSELFGDNISFIYLKRSPVSVVKSFQNKDVEQPSKTPFQANLYLLGVNWLASKLVRNLSKSHKVSIVKYEDLCNSPVSVLECISKDLDIDLSYLIQKIEIGNALDVGMLFDGNRLRLQESIKIKKTQESKSSNIIDKIFSPFHKLIWYNKV